MPRRERPRLAPRLRRLYIGGMAIRLEHRIGVMAPPPVIWGLIEDLGGWPRWNPLYPQVSGRLGYGETLEMTLALPGRPTQTLRPTVIDWTPNELVHWKLSALGGLLKTTRYLEIETLSDTGCIFSNGEFFTGAAARWMPRALKRSIREGFAALGEAVKREAEARVAAEGGARLSAPSDAA